MPSVLACPASLAGAFSLPLLGVIAVLHARRMTHHQVGTTATRGFRPNAPSPAIASGCLHVLGPPPSRQLRGTMAPQAFPGDFVPTPWWPGIALTSPRPPPRAIGLILLRRRS